MEQARQKSLVLILAREFASNLATPLFVVAPDGTLVFYNEPAEAVLGRRFAESGEMSAEEWSTVFTPSDLDGSPLALDELPLGVALAQRVPAHRPIRIQGLDGIDRTIAVTAFPLFAHTDEFVGAVAIFWEEARAGV
jgi:PAS domain-containing protein